jgi:hypothetical protein
MTNSSFESVADRTLLLKGEDDMIGREITIRIGKPYWMSGHSDAACAVEISGLIGRSRDIVGIDPIHALKSAIAFAESFFSDSDDGRKYYWPDGAPYEPF